jgi:hypothetical protein
LKKLLTLCLIILLSATGVQFAPAGARADLNQPLQGLNITENSHFLTPNALYGIKGSGDDETWTLCKGIDDLACVAARALNVINHLPVCDQITKINCVESIYAKDSSGSKVEGQFQKNATPPSDFDYPASEKNNLPLGRSHGGIWKIPGINHSGGSDSYYVSSVVSGWLSKNAGVKVSAERFYLQDFVSTITPVTELNGNYSQSIPQDSSRVTSGNDRGKGPASAANPGGNGAGLLPNAPEGQCVMMGGNICFASKNHPSNYRFGMTLNLGNKMAGWFHGRIYDPVIEIKESGQGQVVSIEAEPVVVPTIFEQISTSAISAELRSYLSGAKEFSVGGGFFMPGNSGVDSMEMASYWIPLVKDKATTSRTYWTIQTLIGEQDANVRSCSSEDGKLAGIVTTNSLTYAAGPPKYNKAEGSLDYQVLSPHYTASGEEAIGSYDLVLRSDVARCIYGFSRAPIQATISIINPDGDNKVATTLVREKNGWLTLSAKGFTYSSPTIRILLSQEAEPTPEVVPAPATPKAAKKTQSITCLKGKVKKVVKGANPTCPKGFKKGSK